jgi:RNA polymerase sigma-70 factor (ECF subfamily)
MSIAVTVPETTPAALAIRGDVDAREALARDCHRQAFLFALQLTRNREDAADVAQDAMVRFFSSIDRFDPSRPKRPWLLRIVRNLIHDRFRRAKVRKVTPLETADDHLIIEPPDPEPDPEAVAARLQMQRLIWSCLDVLTEDQREVLVLRDYQGLSYDEVAETVGIPRGTVMSRLHRARRRLQTEVHLRLAGSREADDD